MKFEDRDIYQQMGNIGSEVSRALKWKNIDITKAEGAKNRAIQLIDLAICDTKNNVRIKEFELIKKEFLSSYSKNEDQKVWEKFFYPYSLMANKKNGDSL